MTRPPFDPFADVTFPPSVPSATPSPKALGWLDAATLPAYAEDAQGRVLYDHRENVPSAPLSRSSAAALGCVAGMLLVALAAGVIGLTR
jgi:hypothetical protein